MTDFSGRLKEERKRLGLSQAGFGALASVSKDAQLNYESGLRTPDASYLQAVARAGVDAMYLLTGNRTPIGAAALDPEVVALLDSYKRASPVGRAAFHVVASLASEQAPKSGADQQAGATISIGGDVGQSIAGDQTNTGPISFSVGKRGKS